MKNKFSFVIFYLLLIINAPLFAAEPDESGIGGTGHSNEPETLLELFNKPDLPDRVDLPDIIVAPDIPEISGGATDTALPSVDTPTSTGTAAGSAPP